jgi:hypothetical protein
MRPTAIRLVTTALVACLASTALVARQSQKLPPDTRIAVVAVHDSQLLTICHDHASAAAVE